MTLKPWREIAVPHEDVLKVTFQQAEFADGLSRVHAGTAPLEYQDPALFFQRTFITEGMRLLLDSVVKRLSGKGGDPVIQLLLADADASGTSPGKAALEALAHTFGRIQALWKPVAAEEAFEIVRRRLFSAINDKLAMESVRRAFADFYTANRNDFPQETQESRYFERLVQVYPIHPEVFDRLYQEWFWKDGAAVSAQKVWQQTCGASGHDAVSWQHRARPRPGQEAVCRSGG
jgi:predicted AAA+ superfamily ATPase